jgi:hypothetical protein
VFISYSETEESEPALRCGHVDINFVVQTGDVETSARYRYQWLLPTVRKVFENRVLRRIFGPKRDEVTGEWRKLHNEELHILYSSSDIIRQIKSRIMTWATHVARMVEERNMYRVLMGKPEGKRSLGRPRLRWEDGIRVDLRAIDWGSVDWIQLAEDRDRCRAVVNTVMNLRVVAPRS